MENSEGAKFFDIRAVPKESAELYEWIAFHEIELTISHEPYHYSRLAVPDFGETVGKTIFVCEDCVLDANNREHLEIVLQRSFNRMMNKRGTDILVRMFVDAHLWKYLPALTKKIRGRVRKELQKSINELMINLRASNPKRAKYGLRRYGPIEKALS